MFKPLLEEQAREKVGDLAGYLDQAKQGPESGKAWVANPCEVLLNQAVVLESDRFDVDQGSSADNLAKWFGENAVPFTEYWPARLKSHFVLIPDDAFNHYVKTKTDIRTRVRIEKGRAAKSGPWTEENLPVDTLLYTTLSETHTGKKEDAEKPPEQDPPRLRTFLDKINVSGKPLLQLGGDQNLGRGMMRMRQLGG
jgi:CRISPR-associated protein Cmr4